MYRHDTNDDVSKMHEGEMFRARIKYQLNNYPFPQDSVFKRHPKGLELMEKYMNRELTAVGVVEVLNEGGKMRGATVDNVRAVKSRLKKHFAKPEIEMVVDVGETDVQLMSAEAKLKRIRKGAKDVIKVDPILGLHSLIAEIEGSIQDNLLTHGDNMRYIALKAKIFELILKVEDGSGDTLDLDGMKRRTDLISMFVYDIASRVDQLIKDVGDEFRLKYGKAMVDEFLFEFSNRLDVKGLYLEFMDTVGDEFDD